MNIKHAIRLCALGVCCLTGVVGEALAQEPAAAAKVADEVALAITLRVEGGVPSPERMQELVGVIRERLPRNGPGEPRVEARGDLIDVRVTCPAKALAAAKERYAKAYKDLAAPDITNLDRLNVHIIVAELASDDPREKNRGHAELRKLAGGRALNHKVFQEAVDAGVQMRQLHGWTSDPAELAKGLVIPGVLELRIAVTPDTLPAGYQVSPTAPPGTKWLPLLQPDEWASAPTPRMVERARKEFRANPTELLRQRDLVGIAHEEEIWLLVGDTPELAMTHDRDAWAVSEAHQSIDELGRPVAFFRVDDAGSKLMQTLTAANQKRALAIIVDGKVHTAPRLMSPISHGGQISGSFSDVEVWQFERALQFPLPVTVKVVEAKRVD